MARFSKGGPLKLGEHFKLHPDDEGVDRIEVHVVPRFKTSGLSGDEWRVSACVRFYRKGELVGERSFTRMESALNAMPYLWMTMPDWCQGPLFSGARGGRCQQAGCTEAATVTYRIKQEYSARGEGPLPLSALGAPLRRFCAVHSHRGDCDLEDTDENYELVSGVPGGRAAVPVDAESPSRTVTVALEDIDRVPDAVQQVAEGERQRRKAGES
jgi:hypothetical protein